MGIKNFLKQMPLYNKIRNMSKAEVYLKQLKYLETHSDITKLLPATGELRDRQLELLHVYDEFMHQKDIGDLNVRFFLIGGALIGYIRHNGFVPWDDDLDFGIMHDEFNKLVNYFREQNLLFYKPYFADQNDKNIEFYNKLTEANQNAFLAVIDYDYELHILKFHEKYGYFTLDLFSFDYYKPETSVADIIKRKKEIEKNAPRNNPEEYFRYINREYRNDRLTGQLGDNLFYSLNVPLQYDYYISHNVNNLIPFNCIFPLHEGKFENCTMWIVNDADMLLTIAYGDYMSFPDDVGYSHHLEKFCD